jgi:hypothetical protein
MTADGFGHLPGTALQPGKVTVSTGDNGELVSILGGHWTGDGLHPLWGYIAAQTGIGASIEDLCAMADFSVSDGPMMGSIELEFSAQPQPGTEYAVTGEVVDLERKHGRSGPFDLLTYRERLTGPDGEVVVVATNTFVLPRRDGTAAATP